MMPTARVAAPVRESLAIQLDQPLAAKVLPARCAQRVCSTANPSLILEQYTKAMAVTNCSHAIRGFSESNTSVSILSFRSRVVC